MYVHERLASEMGEYHAAFGTLTRCSDTQTSWDVELAKARVTCLQCKPSKRY
jgi:hypothetical protein